MGQSDDAKHAQRNPHNHPYRHGKQLVNRCKEIWEQDKPRCVICGEYGSITREHCPPQAIYPSLPSDILIVPGCKACQRSPDREFADILAMQCARKPTPCSVALMEKTNKRFHEKPIAKKYSKYLQDNANAKEVLEYDAVLNRYEQKVLFEWPQGLHDPMMLKFAHAYFWILNEGRILSDMPGRIVVIADDDPNAQERESLLHNAHPSVNIGNGQFIVTLYRGFGEPPYDTTLSMGFHFHTDNKSKLGYNVFIIFLLDQYGGLNGTSSAGEISFGDLQKEAENLPSYDTKTSVHSLYPY